MLFIFIVFCYNRLPTFFTGYILFRKTETYTISKKITHRFRINVEIEEGIVEGIHVVEQGWVEDGRD